MMKNLVYRTFTVWMIMAYICLAAPEPAIVQGPGLWTLDVTFEHPQQMVLQSGPQGNLRRFWYTLITLTNKTNDDVEFYPKCELMTDTFQIIPAGRNVPPVVFEQIKRRHRDKYPFLEPLEKAGNRILQGEDNAKDIAIIWPDFDLQAKNIKIFITGLSNETVAIDHPIAKDKMGEAVKVYLRKTLELSYSLRGDPALRSDVGIAYKDKRWIMR
ncbi:MAG: hypothetical protein ACE5NM_10135 [Sedimentisphaerales bacterium]